MLDSDLAALYGVSTARLNQQGNRNLERFPNDFMFQLTNEEFKVLMDVNQALALLQSWDVEESSEREEQRETWEYLKRALDEDRLSDRKLFP